MHKRLDLSSFQDTDLSREAAQRVPLWYTTPVAGLQFYDYWLRDEIIGRVCPLAGERLQLERRAGNAFDTNAIEIHWRNRFFLGHVPRDAAGILAPRIDAGLACRAYCWAPGVGETWTMQVVLFGDAVEPLHRMRERHAEKCRRPSSEH